MKHLVKVTAEFEFVVLVDDEEDEHQVCENFVADALRDMSTSDVLFNTEVYREGCIDGWDGSIEPYNGAGKSTDEWAALLPEATQDRAFEAWSRVDAAPQPAQPSEPAQPEQGPST